MKKSYHILVCLLVFASCKPKLEVETPAAGEADFSRYVSVGNSLTAGYADNSLYKSGQENSYPNILAQQLKLVGGGDFKQPLVPGEYGYPGVKLVLGMRTNCAGVTSLSSVSYTGIVDTAGSTSSMAIFGPFNNIGVPGIRAVDYLMVGYANVAYTLGNAAFAKRFYKEPNKRPLDELIYTTNTIKPTFFTLWLGANDVLGYASGGGEGNAPGVPVFGIIPTGDITPTDLFQKSYDSVINVLVKNGAKGALINIPDVTSIPLFTTVPPKGLKLTAIEAAYLRDSVYTSSNMSFNEGDNFFVIEDAAAPGGKRQIKENEFILLSSSLLDNIKCLGWGKTIPIPRSEVLSEDEINNVKNATAVFNQIILATAQKYDLAHVDMNSYLGTIAKGIKFNGVAYSADYIGGGAFSLDGVHLTPRGYALVANEIVKAVNAIYHSTIPEIDANKYPGLKFP